MEEVLSQQKLWLFEDEAMNRIIGYEPSKNLVSFNKKICEKRDWMSAHLSIFHVGIGLINFIFINYCPPIFEPRMPSIDCFTIGTWLNLRVKQKRLISQLRKKHSCLYFYCAKNLTEFESETKKANISVCQKSCSIAFLLYQSHIEMREEERGKLR